MEEARLKAEQARREAEETLQTEVAGCITAAFVVLSFWRLSPFLSLLPLFSSLISPSNLFPNLIPHSPSPLLPLLPSPCLSSLLSLLLPSLFSLPLSSPSPFYPLSPPSFPSHPTSR